jgi:hypothetical protein
MPQSLAVENTRGDRILKLVFEKIYVYNKKIQKVQYTASIKQLLDNQAVLFSSGWLPESKKD